MEKKRKNSMQKGSAFEREICKKLSLWFSHGERDDLFHRTAGSGAKSTTRAKKGKTTANSAGDIGYLDAAGKPLIEAVTFELKCGYSRVDTTSLIDTPSRNKKSQLWEFVHQAIESSKNAKSKYWAVIHKRNGKRTLIHFPHSMLKSIRHDYYCRFAKYPNGHLQITNIPVENASFLSIISAPLDEFLELVSPNIFLDD